MAELAVKLATSKAGWLVDKLADKFYSAVSEELSLLLEVREEFRFIKDELEIMSAFLREAEEKQSSNAVAKSWVKQVRELAYDAEDCIDEFSLHLEHRDEHQPDPEQRGRRLWDFVAAFFRRRARSLGSLGARHRIATQVQSIKSRVEEVSNRRLRYGITDVSKASSADDYYVPQYDPRTAALFVEDSQLVGIDGPKEELVGWILDETMPQLSLKAVVGPGGLGKTTIVRKAYQSTKVTAGRFTCRAWITVSQVYSIDVLLRDMIRQIFPSPPEALDTKERNSLIAELREHLKEKRYMIVFDDIWKIDAWNSLALALPNNDNGSRVLLTTRNNDVADFCCAQVPGTIYQHQKLSPQQSLDLFCRRVFDYPEYTCPTDLKPLCEDFLKKCDGLPLAIISIAGVLASKPRRDWGDMLRQLGSQLDYNPNLEGMKQILSFSYSDLPYHIKRCFLYLSKFPEDYLIERKRIERLWIAEGFVTGRRDMTVGEVAESYFNELVNRFMILPSTFNVQGKVKSFRVHDIMLELIVSKSMEDNFVTLLGKNTTWVSQDVIRRLSIPAEYDTKGMSLSHARSLSLFGDGMQIFISPSLGMLRVLDLEGCPGLRNNHLKIIVKLVHLKYLSLRNADVDKLPESLGNLRNLEILDTRESAIHKMPKGLVKLQNLRILHGGFQNVRIFHRGGIYGFYNITGVRIPGRIGRLRSLQQLSHVDLGGSSNDVVKEVGRLNQLRKLGVWDVPEKRQPAFCNSLEALSSSLRSLAVHSDYKLDFLDKLKQPPLLLERLKLFGVLGKLSGWICSLTNVVKIHLSESKLEGDDGIKALGTLHNLIQLTLKYKAYNGEDLCFGAEGFTCLKVLHLGDLDLRSLCFQAGALSHLESVSIQSVYHRESKRTSISGIENLSSLREIKIAYMHNREDLDEVKTQVNRLPKPPRLTVIFTESEA